MDIIISKGSDSYTLCSRQRRFADSNSGNQGFPTQWEPIVVQPGCMNIAHWLSMYDDQIDVVMGDLLSGIGVITGSVQGVDIFIDKEKLYSELVHHIYECSLTRYKKFHCLK